MNQQLPVPVPTPRIDVSIRVATMDDFAALDALQSQYGKALGFFPAKQFEEYVGMGAVLAAQASRPCGEASRGETPVPLVGYIISRDRYLKRDELGVIYQLCVAPGSERKLVGASLVRAAFQRSAYGCRLYCCWCAQDLAANHFWESLGFVPLAFRAGSTGKKRVHIFWQKRIVEGDVTPWWYPFKTDQGAMREDRLVFPIPPGTHWSEVRAVAVARASVEPAALVNTERPRPTADRGVTRSAVRTVKPGPTPMGGFRFDPPSPAGRGRPAKTRKPKAPPRKIDPHFLTAARELRDRYLEHINSRGGSLLPRTRYEVAQTLSGGCQPLAHLPQAAA